MEKKVKRPVIFREDPRFPLENYTLKQIIQRPSVVTVRSICGTPTDFVCHAGAYRTEAIAGRKFWRECAWDCITFKGNRIYGIITNNVRETLIKAFNLDWINDWCLILLGTNKSMWQDVLKGKITNPEMLAKTFSKRYFKGEIYYKNIRDYMLNLRGNISLWDIWYYTTNPNLCIERLTDSYKQDIKTDLFDYSVSLIQLFRDVIEYAKYENARINPAWSVRRLQEEHQKQIERAATAEAESYSNKDITERLDVGDFHLLLNERECFLEGQFMHNCVHSCYWKYIVRGDYLIATATIENTKVDIGITITTDLLLKVDQVFAAYNRSVSSTIKEAVNDWVRKNTVTLLCIANNIKNSFNNKEFLF